jgi:Tol biopolymer transport system component
MAVWRTTGDTNRLEYPVGKVLFESRFAAQSLRVSPKGDMVAMMMYTKESGTVTVFDRAGKQIVVAGDVSAPGLAWSPRGDEVWYTSAGFTDTRPPALYAATLSGRVRLVERMFGWLWLHDIAHDGRLLISNNSWKGGIVYLRAGESTERDLSWLDWSMLADFSPDGKTILFTEGREGAKKGAQTFLRRTDGSPAVRLGQGAALSLSPDGKSALARRFTSTGPLLVLLPTGAGEATVLNTGAVETRWACWFPDGGRILIDGREANHRQRLYVMPLSGGAPAALTPEGVGVREVSIEGDNAGGRPVSPDGQWVAATDAGGKVTLYPIRAGGEPRPVPGVMAGEVPVSWDLTGRGLYVFRRGSLPARLFHVDIASGKRDLIKELALSDPAGIYGVDPILSTPDGKSFVYDYRRTLSDLYVAQGLK